MDVAAAVRAAGLSPLALLDLIHAVAIFAWANRLMLNLFGIPQTFRLLHFGIQQIDSEPFMEPNKMILNVFLDPTQ